MTIIETIMRDLEGLPMRKLVEIARYVHQVSDSARVAREEVLKRTHGCLDEREGAIFERALTDARRIETGG